MAIHFNRGRRQTPSHIPDMYGKYVKVDSIEVAEGKRGGPSGGWWNVTFIVNGWPDTVRITAKDELDAFKKSAEIIRSSGAIVTE